MDAEQRPTERVQDQIDWHNRKSSSNQRNFKQLQVVVIVASALLPLLAGLQTKEGLEAITYVIGGIGLLVAILTGVASLHRFQELWVDYRLTAESLTQEKYRFLTGASPYDARDALAILVERVESVLSEQNSQWQKVAKAEPQEVQVELPVELQAKPPTKVPARPQTSPPPGQPAEGGAAERSPAEPAEAWGSRRRTARLELAARAGRS